MGCFSGCLVSSAGIQKLFGGFYSVFKCSFDEFVGEKVVSPSYSSAILGPLPICIFKIFLFFNWRVIALWNFVVFCQTFVSLFKKIPHVSDIIYLSFCLTSLNMIISRSVHVVANGIILFFLWLSSILLFIHTTSFLSVYRHLNCFHVLLL